jgi:hypothetical protein
MMEYAQLYPALVRRAWEYGTHRTARGKPHRALFNVILETRALDNQLPTSKRFAVAELMSYVCGWDDVAWLARFNKNIAQFSDDGKYFRGAYGPRLEKHIAQALFMLHQDPDSRQIWIPISEPEDLAADTKDKPCNVGFQLQIYGDELHMVVFQRSCDLVWGLPYDHFSFSTLVILFAAELKLHPGTVTRIIGNAHVYEPAANYANQTRLMKAMEPIVPSPWLPEPRSFSEFRNIALETSYSMEGNEVEMRCSEAVQLERFLGGRI